MKKILFYSIFFLTAIAFVSCKEEELGPSIIKDSDTQRNVLDQWYYDNFTQPFNIDMIYKLRDLDANAYSEDDNSSFGFQLVPADPTKCFILSQLIKYFWVDVFTESKGADFIKTNGFRQIQFEGTYRYSANTYTKATAAGGIRIVFCGLNNFSMTDMRDSYYLTETYMKTMYHENTHILNQKKNYPPDFGNVCVADYIGPSQWNSRADTTVYKLGFITPYAGSSPDEDFAEMVSNYVTKQYLWDRAINWDNSATGGGKTDVTKLEQKLAYVRDYMRDAWGIDIDELRRLYQEREAKLGELNIQTTY